MRRLFLVGFALLWLLALNIFAGEIREFDLRTKPVRSERDLSMFVKIRLGKPQT